MSKEISLNNGATWMTADEAMPIIDDRNLWDAVSEFMDPETREAVHSELAPCEPITFLRHYRVEHAKRFGEEALEQMGIR